MLWKLDVAVVEYCRYGVLTAKIGIDRSDR